MRKLLSILLCSCCPIISGPPGDGSSTNWKAESPKISTPSIIDCKNKKINSLNIRTSNTTIQNCIVNGDIRIWGISRNANDSKLIANSKKEDYVSWIRNNSPTNVIIKDTKIIGKKTVPLYIGPGVTFTKISNVEIIGSSDGPMVYLDAESHQTTIENSKIDGSLAARETIAIDGSDHNVIKNNTITFNKGGIFLYRNCGEGGIVRHTTPSYNEISNNTFNGKTTTIWLSSRDGNRCYCSEDSGVALGSSSSDLDHSRFNIITNNKIDSIIKEGKSSENNQVGTNGLQTL